MNFVSRGTGSIAVRRVVAPARSRRSSDSTAMVPGKRPRGATRSTCEGVEGAWARLLDCSSRFGILEGVSRLLGFREGLALERVLRSLVRRSLRSALRTKNTLTH